MTDEELVRFGKEVRRLAENPFQRQLAEARPTVEAAEELPDSRTEVKPKARWSSGRLR